MGAWEEGGASEGSVNGGNYRLHGYKGSVGIIDCAVHEAGDEAAR